MIIPVILLFLGVFGPQGPTQQQVDQQGQQLEQQRQQLDRLQRQTDALSTELSRTQQLLINELKPTCSAGVRWEINGENSIAPNQPLRASLFSTVSMPADGCLPGEVRITATYFAGSSTFICSGSVSVSQAMTTQNTFFEFRPFELELFVKWRDRPTWEQSNNHRLICFDYEGLEVRDPALKASTLRIYATVFGKRGGLATSEIQFKLVQPRVDPLPVPRGFPRD